MNLSIYSIYLSFGNNNNTNNSHNIQQKPNCQYNIYDISTYRDDDDVVSHSPPNINKNQ